MIVQINGKPTDVAADCRVADVVALLTRSGTETADGVAVAVNGEVVTRTAWGEHRLRSGDRVEVLSAQQGG